MFLLFICVAAVAAMVLLAFRPVWGICALFIVRPLVDTNWEQPVFLGLKMTEIVSGGVPLLVFAQMLFSQGGISIRTMPMKAIWILWLCDVAMFCTIIMVVEDPVIGLSMFFRHANGFIGFCMIQTFCMAEKDTRRFVWALVLAGLFPMGTGLYEIFTGNHWSITIGADFVIRNIGMYHDAITMRYYALQTIMGLLLLSGLYLKRQYLGYALTFIYGVAAALVVQKTYSKSGTLTLASWLLLWPLLRRKYQQVLGIAAIVVVAGAWYADAVMKSIGFIFAGELSVLSEGADVEKSFTGRWQIWYGLMDTWQQLGLVQKLFGAGHNAAGAHNDYLQILFHGGIFGLMIYVTLLLVSGYHLVKNVLARPDTFSVAGLLAFIMWMVDTVGLVPSIYPGYQWFVWGVIGLSLRKALETTALESAPVVAHIDPIPRYQPDAGAKGGLMS